MDAALGSAGFPERLYGEYAPLVSAWIGRLVKDRSRIEDLTQETFVHAVKGWPTFNKERPLVNWLLALATNVVRDEARYATAQKRKGECLSLDALMERQPM